MPIQVLPDPLQVLLSNVLERTLHGEHHRGPGDLRGTFATKRVKGIAYWYLQVHEFGLQRQYYLGRDDPELRGLVEAWRHGQAARQRDAAARRRVVAVLRSAGLWSPGRAVTAALDTLAAAGVFQLGAVLVGRPALNLCGQVLGVQWAGDDPSPLPDDPAKSIRVVLAIPRHILSAGERSQKTLASARQGWVPVPPLDRTQPQTRLRVAGRDVRLEFLTPKLEPFRHKPEAVATLGTLARPALFLDYLIADPVMTVLLRGGGIGVRVPCPARLAWHSLVRASRRPPALDALRRRDLGRAEAFLRWLAARDPERLRRAWADLETRGRCWTQPARAALRCMPDRQLVTEIERLCPARRDTRPGAGPERHRAGAAGAHAAGGRPTFAAAAGRGNEGRRQPGGQAQLSVRSARR